VARVRPVWWFSSSCCNNTGETRDGERDASNQLPWREQDKDGLRIGGP
jgi:hypothetical protein